MIESLTFRNDTNKNLTFIVPLIYVEKTINDNVNKIGFGVQQLNFTDINGDPLFYQPLLLNMPSVTEKIDIENKKYTISNLRLQLSNAKYNGKRLSDNFNLLINANISIYYKTQNANILEACLKVYQGKITRIQHNEKNINLSIEDSTQEKLHKNIPINKIPDTEDIAKDYRLEPIPMVYGDVEKSPLVKYVKTIDITEDDDFADYDALEDKTITKMSLLADNIDPELSNNLVTINGYFDNTMNDKVYDIDDAYYKTPLYLYNGDYGNVLNVSTTTEGEIDESNNVFLEDKILKIVKYSDVDGDPINTIAGVGDDNISALLVNKKLQLKNPFASDVEIDNQDHETNYEFLKVHAKLKKILKAQPTGGSIRRNSNDNLLMLPDDYYPYSLGSDMNQMFNPNYTTRFGTNIKFENDSIKRFILGFDVLESDFDFDEGFIVLNFKGWLQLDNQNSFNLRFVKLGSGNELIDYGPRVKVTKIDAWIFTQSGNFKSSSQLGIETFAMVVEPISSFGENNMFYPQIDLFELYHHGHIQDRNVLESNDFYADVSGRTHENIYQFKMNFTLSDTDLNGLDWTEHLGTGIEFDEEGNQTFVYKEYGPNDNFNNFVRISFMSGHSIYPNYIRFYRKEDNEHEYGDINIEFIGTIYDFDNNQYFDNYPDIDFSYLALSIDRNNENDFQEYFFIKNSSYEILKGPNIDLKPLYDTSDIMKDILVTECNYLGEIDQNEIDDVNINHNFWKYAFTQHKEINSKKLLEDLSKSTKSIARFRGVDGKFIWNTIKDEFNEDDVDLTIISNDVLKYSFNRTKLEDVKTKVKVKYYNDYGSNKLIKETDFIEVSDLTYSESGYDYNYYGIDSSSEDSVLEFESKFIREEYTAEQLRNYLLAWHMNQHNQISLDLPLKYVNLEVGDIIAFDKEINDLKLYGETYTNRDFDNDGVLDRVYRNGQLIYPYFMVIETKKQIDKISIKTIQLHENDNNYFIIPEEGEEDVDLPPTGDVNLDESVDVLDIVAVVGFILGTMELTEDQFYQADMDRNEDINILDVVVLVGLILG